MPLERSAVYWSLRSPEFWGRVGSEIEPAGLQEKAARKALEHCQVLHRQGIVPTEAGVMGSMVQLRDRGRITQEEMLDVVDYLDGIEASSMDENATRTALAPPLERRKESKLVDAVVNAHAAHKDVSELAAELQALGEGSGRGGAVMTRLSDVTPQAVEWLWRGRLPVGKPIIIDGDPGLGKSTMTIDLAARVTSARGMPGEDDVRVSPRAVVLVSAEDGIADTIRPRLEAAGGDAELVNHIDAVRDRGRERGFQLADVHELEQVVEREMLSRGPDSDLRAADEEHVELVEEFLEVAATDTGLALVEPMAPENVLTPGVELSRRASFDSDTSTAEFVVRVEGLDTDAYLERFKRFFSSRRPQGARSRRPRRLLAGGVAARS